MNALNVVFLHNWLYMWAVFGPKLWWVVGQVPIHTYIYTHKKSVGKGSQNGTKNLTLGE